MGWREEDLALLKSSIRRALGQQRAIVDQLRSAAVDGSPASCLASRLREVYVALDREAEEIGAPEFDGDEELVDGARIALRTVLESARDLHRATDWLISAERDPIDLGTRYFVDACANDLLPADLSVLIVPRAEYIYAVIDDPLRRSLGIPKKSASEPPGGTAAAAEDFVTGTSVVAFLPELERCTTLLHPLVVHELAHPLVDREQLWLAPLETVPEPREQAKDASETESRLDADKMHRLSMVRAWITEAACDAVAVHYMGPSYLLAFLAAAVAAADPVGAFDTHPPLVTRLRLMVDQCDDIGWNQLSLECAPHIEDLARELACQPPDVEGPYATLDNMLRGVGPRLAEVVSSRLGERVLSPDAFAAEQMQIQRLLAQHVPPAHDPERKSFDRRNVMLASWRHVLMMKPQADLSTVLDDDEVDARLARSLQMIAIVDAWDQAGETH